ncbi:MAG: pantetheine-phosphate adenylyltransferase [Verrucomicrobiota bacterium]
MRIAVYPGTFDPITNGHLDVLERACRLFDKVFIAIAANAGKGPLFSLEEREWLVRENIGRLPNAEAVTFDELLIDLAHKVNATALIRGLRAVSDFEYEFQLAMMNRHLDEQIETIFLMPNEKYFFTSSNIIKQVAQYCGRELGLVPPNVHRALAERFGHPSK